MRSRSVRAALAAALLSALIAAPSASAADPGRWVEVSLNHGPLNYFQGVTHDPSGDFYFAGVFEGLYRTNRTLGEEARVLQAIDPFVKSSVGFNHIGDITYDEAEGGRVILPLECYTPGQPNGGNTCGIGGFGVADPKTLAWRYWVKLDPADIPKAMWVEVSPDGEELWTSAGKDLLVYRTADLNQGNAQPNGAVIKPIRRVANAVPAAGITGAAFVDGRLFLAGQDGDDLSVTSVDPATGASRREIETKLVGESEGLDLLPALGGTLHWQVMPFPQGSNTDPTYPDDKSTLLHFLLKSEARITLTVSPRTAKVGKTTRFRFTAKDGSGQPVVAAAISFGGKKARTDSKGRARLDVRPTKTGRLTAKASRGVLRAGQRVVQVSR
jgi:hypothetical protein